MALSMKEPALGSKTMTVVMNVWFLGALALIVVGLGALVWRVVKAKSIQPVTDEVKFRLSLAKK